MLWILKRLAAWLGTHWADIEMEFQAHRKIRRMLRWHVN